MTPEQRLFRDLRGGSALRLKAGFIPGRKLALAGAPGRLDVMGGIADYSGSWVLEQTLSNCTLAAVQEREDGRLRVVSGSRIFEAEIDRILLPYGAARDIFSSAGRHWASYVAGCLTVLAAEKGYRFKRGFNILICSTVPEGKGVSSSAALETAAMSALTALKGIRLGAAEAPRLCQKVENLVAGAPCGLMDQITVARGRSSSLLPILCRPDRIDPPLPIPSGLCFVGLDSGKGHRVAGSDYSTVRAAAFMGRRMLRKRGGPSYLTELSPSEFETRFAPTLPEKLKGRDFLSLFGGHGDPVTRIEPGRRYPVLAATRHPVWENHRVRLFRALLKSQLRDRNEEGLKLMGELMYQSHQSYSLCGLGAPATDRLVEKARALGPAFGVYGAKITGGGSGGTVALLIKGSPARALAALDPKGRRTRFTDSSDGAQSRGVLVSRL